VDCPPSIGLLCINALRACAEVIIPIEMSLFSLRGVAKLMEIFLLLKDHLDHEVRPRALITMYDFRTRYAQRVLEKVKEKFGANVFESVIRYNIRLRETVDYGLPIGDYDRHSIGCKDYANLAEEVLRAETAGAYPGESDLDNIEDMLLRTQQYMESVALQPRRPCSADVEEETAPRPPDFPLGK
jgi:chromosome partitioning protein